MQILGDWFYYNDSFYPKTQFLSQISFQYNRIYEVLRVVNGKPLFLIDHYERFLDSCAQLHIESKLTFAEITTFIQLIITKNNITTCNIRFEEILEEISVSFAGYLVPFSYPDAESYHKGVKVHTYATERQNPHVKQSSVNNIIREQLKNIYEIHDVFEVLLVDHFGFITEGSRSNVFFVKDNILISPPSKEILEGITRKKVLEIAQNMDIEFVERKISKEEIDTMDACFITGTSPKILPVCQIDQSTFQVRHKLVLQLMKSYDALIKDSCY